MANLTDIAIFEAAYILCLNFSNAKQYFKNKINKLLIIYFK